MLTIYKNVYPLLIACFFAKILRLFSELVKN